MSDLNSPFLKKLKDYPKRESRQSWSTYYQRMRAAQNELVNDPEVISEADLQTHAANAAKNEYLYLYHDGEIKLRADTRVEVYAYC